MAGRLIGGLLQLAHERRRLACRLRLQRPEFGQLRLGGVCVIGDGLGQFFPQPGVGLRLCQLPGGGFGFFGLGLVRRVNALQLFLQRGQLLLEFGSFVQRCRRRDKRATLERGVVEAAVEPDAQLGRQLQALQRLRMAAVQLVIGLVAGLADPVEQVGHFARQPALLPQPGQQARLIVFLGDI